MNAPNSAVTPMMAQFLQIKAEHPDALLWYRMGDFYELFFDDAEIAAQALDITLTKRGKHLGQDIPMCGVPVHSSDGYLLTLIRKGFRVAIAEQLEDPAEAKKRGGAKAVVARGVVRLVTPGTLTEDSLLDARANNFLAAASIVRDDAALAWADISTGELRVSVADASRMPAELARIAPREVILSDRLDSLVDEAEDLGISVTPLPATSFDSHSGARRLCEVFGVSTLEGFGEFTRAEISALSALVDYLDLTQKGRTPLLRPPVREVRGAAMEIDPATRRSLELTQTMAGHRDGALVHVVDRTVTPGGGRLLARRLSAPSRDITTITRRHDAVAALISDQKAVESLREALAGSADIDRALSRLALDRGGPRDMAAIRAGLAAASTIARQLEGQGDPELAQLGQRMRGLDDIARGLDEALVDSPPMLAREGGFIRDDYDADLDEARNLRENGRRVIAGLQSRYASATGIAALKVKHNNVLGYFVETPSTHADKMMAEPLSDSFRHRQTTANALRFTTTELSETESRIINSAARAIEIEKRHYHRLKETILEFSGPIGDAARALSELDVITSFATIAAECDWCRPKIDDSLAFRVEGGLHPVVEAALRDSGQTFVPNDCNLSKSSRLWLLTGPNMAGKSTFLRQNALIAVLAQAGSFVPAVRAHIGIVSQLFSRVGASDELARGRSTFMVEMVETAAILNQADDRALVILDEIGRGTATYDGLSIAWATVEHLHEVNRCRTLFATHYHELTALADRLDAIENATVAVKEWEGDVIFLHEVRNGAADRSYGVQVARLAGLPKAVVARAEEVLETLESKKPSTSRKTVIDDLPLFSANPPISARTPKTSVLETFLADLCPDAMTPRDALDALYEMKRLTTPGSS